MVDFSYTDELPRSHSTFSNTSMTASSASRRSLRLSSKTCMRVTSRKSKTGSIWTQPLLSSYAKEHTGMLCKFSHLISYPSHTYCFLIASRFGGGSVTTVKGMSEEAKQRAQMELTGRDVDAPVEEDSDASQDL